MTPKQCHFATDINFNINSKTTSYWYQLKKKKNYNVSILNPKIIRYPTSPSPINVSSLPLYFCLLTLCLRCYCCLLPPYYATWCHNSWSFTFFSLLLAIPRKFYIRFWIFCSSLQCLHWGFFMYFLFSIILIYLLGIQFSLFIF